MASYESIIVQGAVINIGEGIDHQRHRWALYPEVPTSSLTSKTDKGFTVTTMSLSSELDNLFPGREYHIHT